METSFLKYPYYMFNKRLKEVEDCEISFNSL